MTGKALARMLLPMAFIAFLTSCGEKSPKAEGQIIPREKMIDILADLQIFESTHQILMDKSKNEEVEKRRAARYPEIYGSDTANLANDKNNPNDLTRDYKWVFDHYQVTEEAFRESVDFYSNNPEDFEHMYDEVLIRISEKEAEFTSS